MDKLVQFRCVGARDERRLEEPGGDGVDANALLGEITSQWKCHAVDGHLRRRKARLTFVALIGEYTGGVDDDGSGSYRK